MAIWRGLIVHPRRTATLCAIAASGLGMAYLALAGAPARDIAINAGALLLGLILLGALSAAETGIRRWAGWLTLAGGLALLLTSRFGSSLDGATRWIVIHGLVLQPSLVLLPAMVVGFARRRGWLATAGMVLAALALALQPDRAMAGVLAAGLATLVLFHRDRLTLIALVAAVVGFAASLLQPDRLPAQPFVERVLLTAFAAHPLAGAAAVLGAALLIAPALTGPSRPAQAVFGAAWLAVLGATLLGNYPTPVIGYGGSGVLGYLISLIALPKGGKEPKA
jgi:hypothetical protein